MYNGCNYNENFEQIKRRIEDERKKYKYCYIKGPTGPRGEKGEQGEPGPVPR